MAELDLFDAMFHGSRIVAVKATSTRGTDAARVLDATILAPSGGNDQNSNFIVCHEDAQRRRLAAVYRKAFNEVVSIYAAKKQPGQPEQCAVLTTPDQPAKLFSDSISDARRVLRALSRRSATCHQRDAYRKRWTTGRTHLIHQEKLAVRALVRRSGTLILGVSGAWSGNLITTNNQSRWCPKRFSACRTTCSRSP